MNTIHKLDLSTQLYGKYAIAIANADSESWFQLTDEEIAASDVTLTKEENESAMVDKAVAHVEQMLIDYMKSLIAPILEAEQAEKFAEAKTKIEDSEKAAVSEINKIIDKAINVSSEKL